MKRAIRCIGVLLAIACTAEQPRSISLERTSCYGWCPAYRVVIAADGRIEYSGDGFRETLSETGRRLNPEYPTRASSTLSPAVTAAVFAAFDDGWSRWRKNRYSGGGDECGYDMPTMWLVRSYRARADTMELYYGCHDAPDRLATAAQKVDSLVGIAQWLGPDLMERAHASTLRRNAARVCRPSVDYPYMLELPASGGYRLNATPFDSTTLAEWFQTYLPDAPPERQIVFVRADSSRTSELRWLVPAIERTGAGAYEPDSTCMPPIR